MQELLAFIGALAIVYSIPGPDMILVLQASSKEGFKQAFIVAVGLGLARICHVLLSAVGLAALFSATPWLFNAVRFCGAFYLVWLGISIFRSGAQPQKPISIESQVADKSMAGAPVDNYVRPVPSARWAFTTGFMTNILNPKALLFCSLFLPQFINESSSSIGSQFLFLGAILVGVGLAFDSAFAAFGSSILHWVLQSPLARNIQRYAFSFILVAFGVNLLLMHAP